MVKTEIAIGQLYYDFIYLEGQVLEGIPKCDKKICLDNYQDLDKDDAYSTGTFTTFGVS